jgi:hypothetical protein
MRTSCFRLVLPLLGLLISSSLRGSENPGWNNLKQLSPSQQIRVVLARLIEVPVRLTEHVAREHTC